MPLPWKKTNISLLVADHIQSHKRLETGFPTSLVHLFVKNRDRLNKKNKPSAPAITPSLSPVIHRNSCLTDSISESTYSRRCTTVAANQIDMETVAGDSWSPDVRQYVSVNADAVVKMLVVLVLALGTKKFVIWITVSAFLLFFLEYVGKYLFRIYNPCSNSQIMLELLVKKLPFQITNVTSERQTNTHKEEKPLIQSSEFSTSTAEIKNLEQPESNFLPSVEQTRTSKRENFTQLISLLEVMEIEDEMENISEVSQGNQQNRRRSKIIAKAGSKMKKLVPKKFRNSKKKHAHSRFVIDGSIENDQCQYQYQEQEQEKQNEAHDCELESKAQSLIVSAEKSDHAAEVVDDVRTSREILQKDSKAETDLICNAGDSKVAEEVKRKRVGNLRYWFICLIVLAGLVGGKILALGLTLCWCLVLKAGVIPRKYVKDPLFRTVVL